MREPGSPPQADPRTRRHSTATMLLARTMYAGGDAWSPTQIRRYLIEQMGETRAPSVGTIRTWVVPGEREAQARVNARSHARRLAREMPSDTPLLDRMRQLREAGATQASIAAVIKVDEGVVLSAEQVRYYLHYGREPRIPQRKRGA